MNGYSFANAAAALPSVELLVFLALMFYVIWLVRRNFNRSGRKNPVEKEALTQEELDREIWRLAEICVEGSRRRGTPLDYSQESLRIVDDTLDEATTTYRSELTTELVVKFAQQFGCYILAVGKRQFGGQFRWHQERNQPVLVVGEPHFQISIMTWDKVRDRLAGDTSNNMEYFYAGFAERVQQNVPGDRALYI